MKEALSAKATKIVTTELKDWSIESSLPSLAYTIAASSARQVAMVSNKKSSHIPAFLRLLHLGELYQEDLYAVEGIH